MSSDNVVLFNLRCGEVSRALAGTAPGLDMGEPAKTVCLLTILKLEKPAYQEPGASLGGEDLFRGNIRCRRGRGARLGGFRIYLEVI